MLLNKKLLLLIFLLNTSWGLDINFSGPRYEALLRHQQTAKEKLEEFKQKAIQLLPPKIIAHLKSDHRPINVEFIQLKNSPRALPAFTCATYDEEATESYHQQVIYAKANIPSKSIQMHEGLLTIIFRGESHAQSFFCGHKNAYRQAMAILIHELVHLYDLTLPAPLSSNEQFRYLTGWKRKKFWGGITQKNTNQRGSPDSYEWESPEETLAVNLEFFLMDAEFACRRPALHHVLSQKLNYIPFPTAREKKQYPRKSFGSQERTCEVNNQVYLQDNRTPVSLDPSRVYDIHLLHAASGEKIFSRWGHSMLRLIVCAPERKVVDEKCLNDLSHHVVVSYRANVNELNINPVAGLFGKYASLLYLYTMEQVLDEYGKNEKRDLESIPLNWPDFFSEDFRDRRWAINMTVNQVLENYWAYQGRYYFLTNNCATETQDLLNGGAMFYLGGHQMKSHIIPLGYRNDLTKKGLIDESKLWGDVTHHSSYFFESIQKVLDSSEEYLSSVWLGPSFGTLDELLEVTTANERFGYYQDILKNESETDQKVGSIAHMLEIEKELKRLHSKKVRGLMQEEIDLLSDSSEVKQYLLDYISKTQRLLPLHLLRSDVYGYGIPLTREVLSQKEIDELQDSRKDLSSKARDILMDQFRQDYQIIVEIDRIIEELESLSQEFILQEFS